MALIACGYQDHNPFNDKDIIIRKASAADAAAIAVLCEQLGYPTSQEAVQKHLKNIQQNNNHAFLVAELSDKNIIGWVHIYVCQLVVYDLMAEIGGLVVKEGYRDRGVGRFLMQRAEQWAREKGCKGIEVSSNILREGIQFFYERIGYNQVKTSRVFHKILK